MSCHPSGRAWSRYISTRSALCTRACSGVEAEWLRHSDQLKRDSPKHPNEWGSGGRRFESGRPDLVSCLETDSYRNGRVRLRALLFRLCAYGVPGRSLTEGRVHGQSDMGLLAADAWREHSAHGDWRASEVGPKRRDIHPAD